jgi:hypothetical protein
MVALGSRNINYQYGGKMSEAAQKNAREEPGDPS